MSQYKTTFNNIFFVLLFATRIDLPYIEDLLSLLQNTSAIIACYHCKSSSEKDEKRSLVVIANSTKYISYYGSIHDDVSKL